MQNNIAIITVWDTLLKAKNVISDVYKKSSVVISSQYLLDTFPETLISPILQEVSFTFLYAHAFE